MFSLGIFNEIAEMVSIVDIETYEICFVNKALLKLLGEKSFQELEGEKCYRVFQGKDEPCEYCTNCYLKEDEFYEWSIYNELLELEFYNRDTLIELGGKKCRLEISSNAAKETDNLELFYEKLGNEVLGIALKADDIDTGIQKSIGLLGERMHADRIYIFEKQDEVSNNTYEWCARGVTSEINMLQNISNESLAPWYDLFQTDGEVMIDDLEKIREKHPGIYEVLKKQNIHTLIAQPIFLNKQMIGFFGVDNVQRNMMKESSSFMKMIGIYTSDLIEKRNTRRNLEKMSLFDGLTELYNRKAAERRINDSLKLCGGTLLILDLDNFKAVNDAFGHQKGDDLLKEVSDQIKEVSRTTDIIFRLGGDEFGIYYVSLTDETTIREKCKRLVKKLDMYVDDGGQRINVSASIGVSVALKQGCNFQRLYQSADRALYKVKENGKSGYSISGRLLMQ